MQKYQGVVFLPLSERVWSQSQWKFCQLLWCESCDAKNRCHFLGVSYLFLDVNECFEGSHNCHRNARCINTVGSFYCECSNGFVGNGRKCNGACTYISSFICVKQIVCLDIDECLGGRRVCDQVCVNTEGSFHCSCYRGYELLGDVICDGTWIR